MDMPAVGPDARPPQRQIYRDVQPVTVLVDLRALFRPAAFSNRVPEPHGLQVGRIVTGTLTAWSIAEGGDWFGRVTYMVITGHRHEEVTHWVPAWAIRPD